MDQTRYTSRNKCSYTLSELCLKTCAFGNLNRSTRKQLAKFIEFSTGVRLPMSHRLTQESVYQIYRGLSIECLSILQKPVQQQICKRFFQRFNPISCAWGYNQKKCSSKY